MNKNTLYIAIALLGGLLAGWLIFGDALDRPSSVTETSTLPDHNHGATSEEQRWTCSMHPQIMQSEPGDCPICGMDLIPAEMAADGLALNAIKMTENAMALANIQTTVVGNSDLKQEDSITLSGQIQMNTEENAVQTSYFDGRIEQLNVNYEGQEVKKGQRLATIYSPTLVAAQQELITAAALKQSQPSLYQAVRNKLKLWKLSEAQITNIEASSAIMENFPVYATVSGTVSEKMASEGDYVKQGQPLMKVSNLNEVWAAFDVYENQISEFKKGQKIKVVTKAYPNREFEATLSFIDPVLNRQTRTLTVRADLTNDKGLFKPGMFVTGKIEGKTNAAERQLTIPASAVLWTGERSLVYEKTKTDEPIFEMREITLGKRLGDMFTVVSGLGEGAEIVTHGAFTVDAAAQLQGKKSMMNQHTTTKNEGSGTMELSARLQKNLLESLLVYIQLKDAFVSSDAKAASSHAKSMAEKINAIPVQEVPPTAQTHLTQSRAMLTAIGNTSNLEQQRGHFVILNEHFVPLVLNVEDMDNPLFIQKCPMANSNKGAIWISNEEEIRNPYYGDAMLTCGSVTQVVR